MPVFKYGHRINNIHSLGLLLLLAVCFIFLFPVFLFYLYLIGTYDLLIGSLIFIIISWLAFELLLHQISKRFSYDSRYKGTRKRVNAVKIRAKYAPKIRS